MIDLILAIAHHLAVFSLVAVFATEFALLRDGVTGRQLAQLGAVDLAYGILAAAVIAVGIARVLFGVAGWQYYVGNWVFWSKMGAFILMGLASIVPTMAIAGWRREARTAPEFVPPPAEVARARRFLYLELLLLAFIPTFAAAMARGYGV